MPLEYVLITPARNEAEFIEETIRSVIAQTVLPKRWVIVSDGSKDGTDEIVQRYRGGREWLELVRLPERKERGFAAKVRAFNAGYKRVKAPHLILSVVWTPISLSSRITSRSCLVNSKRIPSLGWLALTTLKTAFTLIRIATSTFTMSTEESSFFVWHASRKSAATLP